MDVLDIPHMLFVLWKRLIERENERKRKALTYLYQTAHFLNLSTLSLCVFVCEKKNMIYVLVVLICFVSPPEAT